MSPTVQFLLQFVPLLVLVGLCTAFVKLSAVVRRFKLSWAHSLLFALVLAATVIAARAATSVLNTTLPIPLAPVLGVSTTLILSSWFFRKRATRPDARPVGVVGGLQLGGVLLALMGGFGLVLLGVLGYAGSLLK
jgi:hypothetical protein